MPKNDLDGGLQPVFDDVFRVMQTKLAHGPLIGYWHKGYYWTSGLGVMYAQEGFPISCSLDECAKHNWIPCLINAVYEMYLSGVDSLDKARKMIQEGLSDMTQPIPAEWNDAIRRFHETSVVRNND